MLAQSPTLQTQLDEAIATYHKIMYPSPSEITESNYASDPAQREAKARQKFASDIMNAITNFIENTIFEIMPGGVITSGSPTTQISTNLVIVNKI